MYTRIRTRGRKTKQGTDLIRAVYANLGRYVASKRGHKKKERERKLLFFWPPSWSLCTCVVANAFKVWREILYVGNLLWIRGQPSRPFSYLVRLSVMIGDGLVQFTTQDGNGRRCCTLQYPVLNEVTDERYSRTVDISRYYCTVLHYHVKFYYNSTEYYFK